MTGSESPIRDRRVLVLLLVVILALLGAGLGTFVLDDEQPEIETPTPNESVDLSLSVPENETLVTISNVAPSHDGIATVTLRNDGVDTGVVRIANLSVSQEENGIFGPEASVDNTTDSAELAEAMFVSLSLRKPDSTTQLYGTTDPQPLAAVATEHPSTGVWLEPGDKATVVLRWQIPGRTGNEIQSDSLRLNATYELVDPNATTPQQ